MSTCEAFREDCDGLWKGLHRHPFVRGLADGTLPPDAFRFYVEQDLFFLPELARAVALGIAAAGDDGELSHFAEELRLALDDEAESQAGLLARATELGAVDRGGSACPAPATVAYGGFLVATAARGGALELMAALLPCTWSYEEIAVALEPEVVDHPVYAAWVRYFASPEYAERIAARREALDRLAAGIDEARRRRLSPIFTMSTRLEHAFWDMAYGLEQWPDLREVA